MKHARKLVLVSFSRGSSFLLSNCSAMLDGIYPERQIINATVKVWRWLHLGYRHFWFVCQRSADGQIWKHVDKSSRERTDKLRCNLRVLQSAVHKTQERNVWTLFLLSFSLKP